MHWIDWIIVVIILVSITYVAVATKQYSKSVADFLVANRCAGRYLLCVAGGISGLGAISIIALFEMYYSAGYRIDQSDTGTEKLIDITTGEEVCDRFVFDAIFDDSIQAWAVTEKDFPSVTLQAFMDYFNGAEHYNGPLATDYVCRKCHEKSIVEEPELDYPFYCYVCDENMYGFEVVSNIIKDGKCPECGEKLDIVEN